MPSGRGERPITGAKRRSLGFVFWWQAVGRKAVADANVRGTIERFVAMNDSTLEDIDKCELESLDALYGGKRAGREPWYDAEVIKPVFDCEPLQGRSEDVAA